MSLRGVGVIGGDDHSALCGPPRHRVISATERRASWVVAAADAYGECGAGTLTHPHGFGVESSLW